MPDRQELGLRLIAAVDRNRGIGYRGRLQIRIPGDLERFRALTLGGAVLYGHNTLRTLPGGKPLAGRQNFLLSHDPALQVEGAIVCHSCEEALTIIPPGTWVIGGQNVFEQLMPCCEMAYLTEIDAELPADAWLRLGPRWIKCTEGKPMTDPKTGLSYTFTTYRQF